MGAGVATIMVTGSKSFGKGNADANMQSQAQLVVNQIEDMIIDTNGGVDYKDDGSDRELILYNAFDAMTPDDFVLSDVDGNGSVTAEDAQYVLKYASKQIAKLPLYN